MNKKFSRTVVQLLFPLFIAMAFIPAAQGISTAADKDTRAVIDMAGRRVTITGPVNRIVTTFKPASLCVLSLGLADRLVGVDNSSRKDRLQLAVLPEIADIEGVGTKSMGINFETLVSLKPELVILYSQKEGPSIAERLDIMKIPSIIIFPETFETIKDAMRLIAKAAGEPEKMPNVERQMDEVLNLVTQRLDGLAEEQKKTGYFSSAIGLYSTTTGSMLQDEIFKHAGIKNVSSHLTGYFQDISPEQLVNWNPDIMVLSQHLKAGETRRLSEKPLQQIKAISQKAVYRCPSSLAPWDFPSPLSVLATLWIAKKAYPKRFSDIDTVKQADVFHKALFGKSMTQMGGVLMDTVD